MPNAIFLILSSCNNLGWGITQMDLKSSGFSPKTSLRTELEVIEEGNSMTRNNVRTPMASISEPRWGTFQAINLLVLKIWNKLLRLDTQPLFTSAWPLPHMWVKLLGLTTSHLHSIHTMIKPAHFLTNTTVPHCRQIQGLWHKASNKSRLIKEKQNSVILWGL